MLGFESKSLQFLRSDLVRLLPSFRFFTLERMHFFGRDLFEGFGYVIVFVKVLDKHVRIWSWARV